MADNKSILQPLTVMTPEQAQTTVEKQHNIPLSSYISDEITKLTEGIGTFHIGQKINNSKQKKKNKKA